MSLIVCPECKENVSDKSQLCVKCGFPIAQHLQEQAAKEGGYRLTNTTDAKKSIGMAVLLAFLFGPFGTFYAHAGAAVVMCFVYLFSLIGGPFGLFFASIVNIVLAAVFVSEHNSKIDENKGKIIPIKKDDDYDVSSGW